MKLTKQKLHEMIAEAMREGNEAQEIYKILKGWWSAAAINEHIRESYTETSETRKGGYNGNPIGTDEFFGKYYVGKNFKLEFLNWTQENKWKRKKYGGLTWAVAIAITDIVFKRFPELKELADWGMRAGTEEVSRVYPNTQNVPNYRFRPDIALLVNAIIAQNPEHEAQMVEVIQHNIDGVRALRDSDFDYEGKAPEDWKGYE